MNFVLRTSIMILEQLPEMSAVYLLFLKMLIVSFLHKKVAKTRCDKNEKRNIKLRR